MKFQKREYLDLLKKRFSGYLNIEENIIIKDIPIDLYCRYIESNSRYFVSRSIKVYNWNRFEQIFAVALPSVDQKLFNKYITTLKEEAENLIQPNFEHMATMFTLVFLIDSPIEEAIAKEIRKFKYQKGFWLGLKGWYDLRIVGVSLKTGELSLSPKAKVVKSTYSF